MVTPRQAQSSGATRLATASDIHPATPRITRPRVLIIMNDRDSGPRSIPHVCSTHGVDVEVVDATRTSLPSSLVGFAGLVMLGGGLMPDDDGTASWLPAERHLANQAIATDIPTLGICLGAQILAYVGGGIVRASGPSPERGATHIDLTGDAYADALLSAVPQPAFFMENHRDYIEALPASAVLLASSDRCTVQAFRIGEHVWGVQFHPEVPPERALEFDPARLASDGFDSQSIIDFALLHGDEVRASSLAVLRAFAHTVSLVAAETQAAAPPRAATSTP